MTKKELESLTIAELRALAKKKKVVLPAGARKADIVSALARAKSGTARKTTGVVAGKKKAQAKKAAAGTPTPSRAKPAARASKAAGTSSGRQAAAAKVSASNITVAAGTPVVSKITEREWLMPAGRQEPATAQERVADAKFYTGTSATGREMSYGSLPHEYGQDRIVLLARDPRMVFAFWEVTKQRLDEERKRIGSDARLCVRVYDVTGVAFDGGNETAYFDQEVYERVGSWYLDLGRPGHAFCADLGVRLPSGRFHTLFRSNTISMPREGFSDVLDEEWIGPEEEFLRLYAGPLQGLGGISSAQVRELMRKRRALEISSPGMSARSRRQLRR